MEPLSTQTPPAQKVVRFMQEPFESRCGWSFYYKRGSFSESSPAVNVGPNESANS